tara:strand:- start:925 stop:1950 length:1026 start_codon:yes stop_codon:yes gene_type:complete
MSKILRRPMFRGGPVDSYNTGIASGLGQPRIGAKRGRFFGDVGNPYTAPLLMDTASVLPPIRRGRIRGPKDFEASKAGTISDAEGLLASNAAMNDATLNVPTYDFEQEDELVNVGDVELGLPKSKVEDLTTEKVVEKVKDGDDEVEVTMTDLEKALGLDKARRRDLGDMLGRASAAFLGAGDVREGLAEFMTAEAKAGPSRTERIKSIAGLEEFKAKKAKELYESKLAATLKQKAGTKGSLQKDIEYLGTLSGADRIAALGKLGYKAPSLSAAIKELKITGQAPDAATIINLATLYEGPDFKGIVDVTEELSGKPAGTYITTDATALIIIDEQGNTRLQKL